MVGEAASGYEAQALCRDLQPDIMVLDLNMPGPPATETVAYVQKTVRSPRAGPDRV